MNKIKLSIIALSCFMALGACSSSSKGGSDNSEQIRQAEVELNQRIAEAKKLGFKHAIAPATIHDKFVIPVKDLRTTLIKYVNE